MFQRTRHGLCDIPEYSVWKSMRKRCNNPKDKFYYRYGGRGISICPEWDIFEIFYGEMGPRPSNKHSLDRIDNDGNYEKKNCRWVTIDVQVISRRKSPSLNLFPRKNKTGCRGVDKLPSGNFRAKFKNNQLGVFKTKKEASDAYRKARRVYYESILQALANKQEIGDKLLRDMAKDL